MVQIQSLPLFALLASASASISAAGQKSGMVARQLGDTNCKPVMVIFARGTTEVSPLGSVAGPPFQAALAAKLGAGNFDFQGVSAPSYPADVSGYLSGGSAAGSSAMANMVRQAATNCPSAKIIMSGYSQGGQLVHNAGKELDSATASKVAGAVIFGDPDNPKPVANVQNLKVFCAAGDLICAGQSVILAPHLSYGANAGAAADFVASVVGN